MNACKDEDDCPTPTRCRHLDRCPNAGATPEQGAAPLVGTGSWLGDRLRAEAEEIDKVAKFFDDQTPHEKATEYRAMAETADKLCAALANAKTLLCEKYEFEAAAEIAAILKAPSPNQ